jgi:hypothetical protein
VTEIKIGVFREVTKSTKIVHVNTWSEFKRLAIAQRPEFMAYTVQKAPLSKPPIGLKLIFSTRDLQYVFLDFAHGSAFRRTKLPVHINESGDAYFDEEELKSFIYTELNRKDILIISFEVLGGY